MTTHHETSRGSWTGTVQSVLMTAAAAGSILLAALAPPAGAPVALTAAQTVSADEIHYSFGDTGQVVLSWRGVADVVHLTAPDGTQWDVTGHRSAITPVDDPGPFNEALVTGLQPGAPYRYRIGDAAEYVLHAAPASGLHWVDVGDVGATTCWPWVATTHRLIAALKPDVVNHGGDISYANYCGTAAVHQAYLDEEVWSTSAAAQFTWGNHEFGQPSATAPPGTPRDSLANYKGRSALTNAQTLASDTASRTTPPGCLPAAGTTGNGCRGEDWGWYDAGRVRFISYPDTAMAGAFPAWTAQAAAVMQQAQDDPSIDLVVTYGHRPAYSSTSAQVSAPVKTALDSLGDRFGAAVPGGKYRLNVAHHAHNEEVFAAQHGVVHVTSGGGGQGVAGFTTVAPGSLFRTVHPGFLSAVYDATTGQLRGDVVCGPAFAPNPKQPCVEGSVLYRLTLQVTPSAQNPPVAMATGSCARLSCTFDARASSGDLTSWAWRFDDGATASGALVQHTFSAAGEHQGTVTVTDTAGRTATATATVQATDATPSALSFVDAAGANGNVMTLKVTTPTSVHAGDGLVLVVTANAVSSVPLPAGGWVPVASTTNGTVATAAFQKVATAADAGAVVKVPFGSYHKSDGRLLAYRGTAATGPVADAATATDAGGFTHVTPTVVVADAGRWVVSYWSDKSSATTSWTLPAAVSLRSSGVGAGTGRMSAVAADSAAAVPPGSYGGLSATADGDGRATTLTLVLAPAG
ncbi:MAG: PKD domain-containing protein [Angustibacter sp.]